jgi:hypothetical protein
MSYNNKKIIKNNIWELENGYNEKKFTLNHKEKVIWKTLEPSVSYDGFDDMGPEIIIYEWPFYIQINKKKVIYYEYRNFKKEYAYGKKSCWFLDIKEIVNINDKIPEKVKEIMKQY